MTASIDNLNLITPSNPADGLISDAEWQLMGRLFKLSNRELTVAQLVFAGESRERIALALRKSDGTCLSPETVRVYIDRLSRKLNVSDQMQLAIQLLRVRQLLESAE